MYKLLLRQTPKNIIMNVLILGSGGREHALAWKIKQSSLCGKLFVAPGNAGTSQVATNLAVDVNNFNGVGDICLAHEISLLVVGSEDPLVNGIKDHFKSAPDLKHVAVIGPDAAAAQLEGSKDFCKRFMAKYNVPTAAYNTFSVDTLQEGKRFLETLESPYVLKADGLAAGKGVLIIEDLAEAKTELENMLNGKFGAAGAHVVIEEFLDGIEFSVFALTDGKNYKILPVAKDYKRINEGDKGLNTGGMGAVSPVAFADAALMEKVEEKIVKPTIAGFSKEGMDYTGFVFFGLIKVGEEPYVIEYNVRMGDPETEVVMPRITSDFVRHLMAAANGTLDKETLEITDDFAATVMAVSGGYPEKYEKQKVIEGLDKIENAVIFHAGTMKAEGKVLTNGGRVLAFTGMGKTKEEALTKSYAAAKQVNFSGMYYRKDIGFDL